MKLTSQEEYGLRCILALARPGEETDGGEPAALTVAQIAEREGLSTEYAGKLMGVLVRAGFVESERGRYGGYRLSRAPHEISVAEVLAALGGKLYDRDTCDRFSGDHELCVHTGGCTLRSVWSGLQQIIDQVLTQTTLWDVIQQNERGMRERIRRHASVPAPFEVGDPIMVRPVREG
ncbi:MAG: Rrf2 family transcriptional regulator [Candidatus Eisenbacteria bacterium]|uniref:Rrf2 family transcriptional regulator n=1 Tax=Eiseniibacteriota bacterium TaxID=2212470 RepID=A0A956LW55_UNCEI|nr:Rrf2 family transcriptional regulator [Candidatus Eisenbacteria bacterium]